MGKGADAPDTVGAARETGEQAIRLNEAQTRANRPNQSNPWGSTNWETNQVWNPVTGNYETQWTQTESLDPRLQSALDAQLNVQQGRSDLAEGMMARAWDQYQDPMDFGQFGDVIGPEQVAGEDRFNFNQGLENFEYDPLTFRQNAEDAAYQRATSRLDPQWQAQEQSLMTRLRNQGLSPGDQAYDAAVANFNRSRNDAYEQARLGSVAEGRAEDQMLFGQQLGAHQQNVGQQGQLFGQALQGQNMRNSQQQQEYAQAMQNSQYANALRSQQIQEALYQRGYPLSEVERLLAGQSITGGPPSSGGQTQTENQTMVGNMLMGE
jgi:hypothetical protein